MERYTGESTIWVQTKNPGPDLVFYAYWGNENNTTAPTYRTDGSIWSGYDAVWHFSNYDDSSANDQNLTVQGAPEFSTNYAVSGESLFLDGNDDFLEVVQYGGIWALNPRTIESWVRTSQNTGGIMSWGTNGNRWNYGWDSLGPYILTERDGGVGAKGAGILDNNSWNHLLVSFPGGDLNTTRIYLNGRLIDAPASSTSGVVDTGVGSDTLIGALRTVDGPNSHFHGWVDEARISSGSRSQGDGLVWPMKTRGQM